MSSATLSPVELYRLLHTGNAGNLDFYLRAAEGSESVLELGAGWGRLSVELARRGHRVTAVELEPQFVELGEARWAREQAGAAGQLTWLTADLRDLALEQRFDRVLLPYNTLYALGGLSGVRRALEVAARHLGDDGEIWFDVYRMDDFHESALRGETPEDDERELVATLEHGGRSFDVYERTELDLVAQRLDVTYQAESTEGEPVTGRLQHHYLLTSEIEDCLASVGLELAATFADFQGHPFGDVPPPDLDGFVACAVRAAS